MMLQMLVNKKQYSSKTVSDKILKYTAYEIALNSYCDEYQR